MIKRNHICFITAWSSILLLCSCSHNGTPALEHTDTNSNQAVTDDEAMSIETEAVQRAKAPDDFPAVRYDGETFTILYRGMGVPYAVTDVIASEMTGEIINDSIFERNARLEQQYGISFVGIVQEDPCAFARHEIMSGTASFDVMTDQMTSLHALAADGYLNNFYDLAHFDPSDTWWDSNAAVGLSIGNHLYMMIGDISMNASSRARFLYINKKIASDYDLTVPYELVREGRWTFDHFNEMVCTVSMDVNGDGMMDGEDQFGMLTENSNFFLSGCGIIFTEKDASDLPYLSFVNERSVSVLSKVQSLFDNKKHAISYEEAARRQNTSDYAHIYDFGRALFAQDHFLFVQNGANVAYQFSQMPSEYGILPNPKYDEAQESYYHLMDPFACAWAIPVTNQNLEKTDILMNWWGYLSSNLLVDAFYETTIKYKRLNAPEDAEMLDIVRGSIRYEIAMIADLGVTDVLNAALKNGNLISSYEKQAKRIGKKFDTVISSYTKES